MSPAWAFPFCILIAYQVLASPISGIDSQSLSIILPLNASHRTTSSTFLLAPPSNISATNALNIECDGAQYGNDLNITDCKHAKNFISSGSEQCPWVDRHTLFLKPHFALPYRYMGDSGQCYIQIGLAPGYDLAYASLYEVQSAANAVISRCTAGSMLRGGKVTNIGADGGLTMVLGAYRGSVECRGTFEPIETCASIIDDIDTTQITKTFGLRSDPTTDIPLPVTLKARDGKSAVRVFGRPDTTSWYRIWEAVMLVYSVCARGGRGGVVRALGDHGNLFLTMTARTGLVEVE